MDKNLESLKIFNNNQELLKRIFKYFLQAVSIVLAIYFIPDIKLKKIDIIYITIVACTTFGVIDLLLPSILIKNN